jgi:hypothetical protein
MQVEAFVKTEDRTPLEYIVRPLMDQIAKAFRERWTRIESSRTAGSRMAGELPVFGAD